MKETYLSLKSKSEVCILKAIDLYKSGESSLAKFYKNASEEFLNRALNLEVKNEE